MIDCEFSSLASLLTGASSFAVVVLRESASWAVNSAVKNPEISLNSGSVRILAPTRAPVRYPSSPTDSSRAASHRVDSRSYASTAIIALRRYRSDDARMSASVNRFFSAATT